MSSVRKASGGHPNFSKILRKHDRKTRELKQYIVLDSSTPTNPSANYALTSGISQGDNVSNRDGWSINAISLEIRLSFILNSSGSNDIIRVVVFGDKMNLNTAPSVLDLLDVDDDLSPYNYGAQIAKRFTIYKDELIPMTNVGANRTVTRMYRFQLNDLPLDWWAASSSTGKNHIYLHVGGDATVNPSNFGYSAALRFYDS